jgi:Anti-sigma-D factor RsdA to sigma factor binding region
MPEFGYVLPDPPALDEVARTDLLLDALAERTELDLDDPKEDALAALMGEWRDDLRWPPASALISQQEAEEALIAGISEPPRSRRGLATIGTVAAALLLLSGFGALVVEARPGETLYGMHAMFFDEPQINQDQTMLSAQADLAKVQQMIDQGQWDQAQSQLTEVNSMVQSMTDGTVKQNLMDQVKLLNTKVETRNPNATLPPPQTKPVPAASVPPAFSPPNNPAVTSPRAAPPSPLPVISNPPPPALPPQATKPKKKSPSPIPPPPAPAPR